MMKRIIAACLSMTMLFVSGCKQVNSETSFSPSSDTVASSGTPDTEGEITAGFKLMSTSDSEILGGKIMTFSHEKSGAELVYIQNDDKELAFSIAYRTPCVDESDINHIFEHAILASSEKYISKDIFFDMVNKCYKTYINATTYPNMTAYPLASQSEEQLMKMADVYLSCMVAPSILEEENFFKREALRYELHDKNEPITMTGTVLAEDTGMMTDTFYESINNTMDTLFPNTYESNMVGRAHINYSDVTYEKALDIYKEFYRFDNSLITLYGDMDYKKFMTFIDEEYLSKAEKHGTDLTKYLSAPPEAGFVEETLPVPAYEGDAVEKASYISYAMDVSDWSVEDQVALNIMNQLLGATNSPLQENLRKKGISNMSKVEVDTTLAKPVQFFILNNADPVQNQLHKEAVVETLTEIAKNGFEKSYLESILKSLEMDTYLTRNNINVGVDAMLKIASNWSVSGRDDYYQLFEQTLKNASEDKEQSVFKKLANDCLNAKRSALVVSVPTPGLAEEIEKQRDDYLAEMKVSMTDAELDKMILETKEFDQWNKNVVANDDFSIDASVLPEQKLFTDFEKREESGITLYAAPANIEKMGKYGLYFDSSALTNEEMGYFILLFEALADLPTKSHTSAELKLMKKQYLHNIVSDAIYPTESAGKANHPMLSVFWNSETADYEKSLDLLMETLRDTKYDDVQEVLYILDQMVYGMDPAQTSNPNYLAKTLAQSAISDNWQYENYFVGQEAYQTLKDIQQKLTTDPTYINELAEKMHTISEKLLQQGGMYFTVVCPQEDIDEILASTVSQVEKLPVGESKPIAFEFADLSPKRAFIIEASNQNTIYVSNVYKEEDFTGKTLPFFSAIEDQHLIPKIRFQLGAYGAQQRISLSRGQITLLSYRDPNVGATLDVFDDSANALRNMKLSQDELKGYMLNAFGSVTIPSGVLDTFANELHWIIMGVDRQRRLNIINDIKNATIADQQKAADCMERIYTSAVLVTVGNVNAINAETDRFDEVNDLRQNS